MASTSLRLSLALHCNKGHSSGGVTRSNLANYFRPPQPPSRATALICSSRRRKSSTPSVSSKKINKKKISHKNVEEDEDVDEDAFEALFRQLEEDLKNDDLHDSDGEDDEISDEELAKLERELAEALEDDDIVAAFGSILTDGKIENLDEVEDDTIDGDEAIHDEEEEEETEDEEEEWSLKLKNWQLKRLAYALKTGRRKTNIKNLAADLCLDRAVVLKLLRDPPPNLVLMSAALPDKPISTILEPVEKPTETFPSEATTNAPEPKVETKFPVHVMQSNWSARKRLKKVQIQTLEQVYKRTKRPTNAMISSIVHVTNLPRRRVLKWFEDKRNEDGIPENRVPYQRPASESVFTS